MSIYKDYASLRKDIGKLQKSGTNPHFKNTYVELNTALEEIDKCIEKHNFVCFIQVPITIDGKNYLHTELIHSSGEKIEGDLELITVRQDPQMLGSSLTYARRYSLITMLGLQAVDDDGNEASGRNDKTESKTVVKEEKKEEKATKEQLDEIARLAKLKGSVLANISKNYKVASCAYLTFAMAKDCIAKLKLKENV